MGRAATGRQPGPSPKPHNRRSRCLTAAMPSGACEEDEMTYGPIQLTVIAFNRSDLPHDLVEEIRNELGRVNGGKVASS